MKSLLIIPALICAFLLASVMSSAGEPVAHRTTMSPVVYQGKVSGWSITVGGTVTVQLEGTYDSEPFALWFATPASRTNSTNYENLVLEAILAASGPLKNVLVTVVSESSNVDSGKSIETALTLNSISQF